MPITVKTIQPMTCKIFTAVTTSNETKLSRGYRERD
jgi:hypothetical protein